MVDRAPAGAVGKAEPHPFALSLPDTVHIGLPPVLAVEKDVQDPVFGILISLVSSGIYGTLSGERLAAEMNRLHARSHLPYRSLVSLTRLPVVPGRMARVQVQFHGDLDLPIPYSILGYHPGSFTASETCVLREWMFDTLKLTLDDGKNDPAHAPTVELNDVHLFGVEQGRILIDIDGWLDAVMGGALDDTGVTCLMLCRRGEEWLGFAMGYNKDGNGRSGALSFVKDAILFPTPAELRGIGPRMRSQEESLMRRWPVDAARSLGARSPG